MPDSKNVAPELSTMLTLSSAHLSKEDAARLDTISDGLYDLDYDITVYRKGDFGWFVSLPDPSVSLAQALLSSDSSLRDCILFARKFGASWIEFDRDGPQLSDLPRYPWK